MTALSVNINKIALIRNSRGADVPHLPTIALDCERFGAQGITIHPRPDERHATYNDVAVLKGILRTELNVEGYPSRKFLDVVLAACPAQVTLVPDAPDAITSNSGWDTVKHASFLKEVTQELHAKGIRVSIFVNPDEKFVEGAAAIGAQRIELYTEPYAAGYATNKEHAIEHYIRCSSIAPSLGLEVNAGHDLNLHNLAYFKKVLPVLHEVSIGHALVSDALYFGLEATIAKYLACLR